MPIRSMTGFGAAEGPVSGGRLRLEVKSVNHRHLNVQLKVPGQLMPLELDLRERLRSHLERGAVTVWGKWTDEPPAGEGVTVDSARARAVVEALRGLGRDLGISGDVDLATVSRIPDVVRVGAAETSVEPAEVMAVLDEAARACVLMREREGAALAADLRQRAATLESLAAQVAERAPQRLVAERDRLAASVKELAAGVALDPDRLAKEVALIADRLDITEELVRFRTHLKVVLEATGGAAQGVGKQLSFILQELGREANTMGSKANDAGIAAAVIAMKGELERMREQVENLE